MLTLAVTLSSLTSILYVILGLGFVVFVHELGHFLAAKACGVKCEKFYVGFDVPLGIGPFKLPRTLLKFQWGETEYGIGVIPLGGYVKMLGQDDNPANAQQEAERIRIAQEDEAGDGQPREASAASDVLAEGVSQTSDAGQREAGNYVLDPRSYPAKPVWQRMIIISAGVIMNLIFAVVFGAFAYSGGVKYLPCEIAAVTPGSPAWIADVRPGDKLVRIGEGDEVDEHLRFNWELRYKVLEASIGKKGDEISPLKMAFRRGDDIKSVVLRPNDAAVAVTRFATIGVVAPNSTRLNARKAYWDWMAAGRSQPPLAPGDQIIAVDGVELDRSLDNERGEIPITQLEQLLSNQLDRELNLTVLRKEEGSDQEQPLEVRLPAQKMQRLGVVLTMGPIRAIQQGAPADGTTLQVGDVIHTVAGEPVGDPVTLPQRIGKLSGPVTLGVRRGDAEPFEVTLTPRADNRHAQFSSLNSYALPFALESLGIAYDVQPLVAAVLPGTSAERQGVQVGDRIASVQMNAIDKDHERAVELFGEEYNQVYEVNDIYTWTYFHGWIQTAIPNMKFTLSLERGGERTEVTLERSEMDDFYFGDRGLLFSQFNRLHTASSWSEACALGLRETKEKLFEVINALGMMVKGRVKINNIGGPLRVFGVASSEASQGVPRLLLFLTFLSANLAIINFLPIPALDGGHMLFLVVESIIRRPIDERLQNMLTAAGFLFLIGLMLFVIFNDIAQMMLS